MSNPKITDQQKNRVRKRLNFDTPSNNTESELENKPANILDLSKMTEQQKMEHTRKWNFDFENEVPLDGDWQWEKVVPVPLEPPLIIEHKELVKKMQENKCDDRNI